ncbi:sugar porter family MFS transporter [Formicincola oecophyllae]|uniref:Sugar porter family MFS transporter n=1 Tax=Formicincola oecophyllae TaxID=2558361 RepID=A0A4Y6U889_9PROT|nr:sugar porter family MFS transporter [Formicincola oecophyllae]QDH13653.1 sugar porter family MFS transporter [Formicincola oecophyllae]
MTSTAQPASGPNADATNGSAARRIMLYCILTSLAALLVGLDTGLPAGVINAWAAQYHVDPLLQGGFAACMLVGAIVGAMSGGFFCQHYGRKKTLSLAGIFFAVGALCAMFSWNVPTMFASRAIVGLGFGLTNFTGALYLSEIALPIQRGIMVSTFQLFMTIGILVQFFYNTLWIPSGNWRGMISLEAAVAVVFVLGSLILPESPRWLAAKGEHAKALKVLTMLRATPEEAQAELDEALSGGEHKKSDGWHLFRTNSNFRRSVGLGMLLQIFQQFCGINAVLFYAPKVLQAAHFGELGQMWGTVAIGAVNAIMTVFAMRYSDRLGRRPIMYLGCTAMTIAMGGLAFLFTMGWSDVAAQFTTLALIFLFVAGFAMSAGPIVWLLCAEIQPAAGRDFGVTVSTATNLTFSLIIAQSFPAVLAFMGKADTFWLLTIFNVLGLLLIYFLTPETKDVSLDTIEKNLLSGKKLRDIGR